MVENHMPTLPAHETRSEKLINQLRPFAESDIERIKMLELLTKQTERGPKSFRRWLKIAGAFLGISIAVTAAAEAHVPQALESALKFQGLRVYSALYDYTMTGNFLNRFLDRSGENMDITELFPNAISEAIENRDLFFPPELSVPENPTAEDLIAAYVAHSMPNNYYGDGQNAGHSYTYGLTHSEQGRPNYLTDVSNPELLGQRITFMQLQRGFDDDTTYSLGAFTLRVTGTVTSINPDNFTISLSDLTVEVVDHYDWRFGLNENGEKTDVLNVRTTVGRVLTQLGVTASLPEGLANAPIQVDDNDGQRLVDTGLAAEFPVSGQWHLDSLTMAMPFVELPPADVMPAS